MSIAYPPLDFNSLIPPANYVAGMLRKDGFSTGGDSGYLKGTKENVKRQKGDINVSEDLAEERWRIVDQRMQERREKRRDANRLKQIKERRAVDTPVAQVFSDARVEVATMDISEWESMPAVTDQSGHNKVVKAQEEQRHQVLSAVPDTILRDAADRDRPAMVGDILQTQEAEARAVEAIASLKAALDDTESRGDEAVWIQYVEVLQAAQRLPTALAECHRALQHVPDSSRLMVLAAQLGPKKDAVQALQTAVAAPLPTDKAPLLLELARCDTTAYKRWRWAVRGREDPNGVGAELAVEELVSITTLNAEDPVQYPLETVRATADDAIATYPTDPQLWAAALRLGGVEMLDRLANSGLDQTARLALVDGMLHDVAPSTAPVLGAIRDMTIPQAVRVLSSVPDATCRALLPSGALEGWPVDRVGEVIAGLTSPVCPSAPFLVHMAGPAPSPAGITSAMRASMTDDDRARVRAAADSTGDLLTMVMAADSPAVRQSCLDRGRDSPDFTLAAIYTLVWGSRPGPIPVAPTGPAPLVGRGPWEVEAPEVDRILDLLPDAPAPARAVAVRAIAACGSRAAVSRCLAAVDATSGQAGGLWSADTVRPALLERVGDPDALHVYRDAFTHAPTPQAAVLLVQAVTRLGDGGAAGMLEVDSRLPKMMNDDLALALIRMVLRFSTTTQAKDAAWQTKLIDYALKIRDDTVRAATLLLPMRARPRDAKIHGDVVNAAIRAATPLIAPLPDSTVEAIIARIALVATQAVGQPAARRAKLLQGARALVTKVTAADPMCGDLVCLAGLLGVGSGVGVGDGLWHGRRWEVSAWESAMRSNGGWTARDALEGVKVDLVAQFPALAECG